MTNQTQAFPSEPANCPQTLRRRLLTRSAFPPHLHRRQTSTNLDSSCSECATFRGEIGSSWRRPPKGRSVMSGKGKEASQWRLAEQRSIGGVHGLVKNGIVEMIGRWYSVSHTSNSVTLLQIDAPQTNNNNKVPLGSCTALTTHD